MTTKSLVMKIDDGMRWRVSKLSMIPMNAADGNLNLNLKIVSFQCGWIYLTSVYYEVILGREDVAALKLP